MAIYVLRSIFSKELCKDLIMTPKAKAEELYTSFIDYAHSNWDDTHGWDAHGQRNNAKECALIAVKEILYTLSSPPAKHTFEPHMTYKATVDYWQQVKTEIENL